MIKRKIGKMYYNKGCKLSERNEPMEAINAFDKAAKYGYDKAHLPLARALKSTGNNDKAAVHYLASLDCNPKCVESASGLAEIIYPGACYEENLSLFHKKLQPKLYVEIGVATGKTLALVSEGTKAIGIDPEPQQVTSQLTHISKMFPVTSDQFFQDNLKNKTIKENQIDFAFIDGLHTFEQVLKDFINIEKYSRKDTVVCIHDCLPLTEFTATPERNSDFWTGDVWKIIPCLIKYRPDLKIFTIPTRPSGLGVISNLNPKSTVLQDNLDNIFLECGKLTYPTNKEDTFQLVTNNWNSIQRKLGI